MQVTVPLSSDALCGTCDLGRGLWTGGSHHVDLGMMVTVASAAGIDLCTVLRIAAPHSYCTSSQRCETEVQTVKSCV